jgi:hypothetical protein
MGRAGIEPATLGLKVPQKALVYSRFFSAALPSFPRDEAVAPSFVDFIAPWTICLTMCPTQ